MLEIECYWNVRRGLWSIREVKTRRVIDRLAKLTLRKATFRVSEAGRQRVLRTGVKNVHAVVRGEWDFSSYAPAVDERFERVRYNPRRCGTFTTDEGAPVVSADEVTFWGDRAVFARGISEA